MARRMEGGKEGGIGCRLPSDYPPNLSRHDSYPPDDKETIREEEGKGKALRGWKRKGGNKWERNGTDRKQKEKGGKVR